MPSVYEKQPSLNSLRQLYYVSFQYLFFILILVYLCSDCVVLLVLLCSRSWYQYAGISRLTVELGIMF